jgi:hypothetical protein
MKMEKRKKDTIIKGRKRKDEMKIIVKRLK